MTFGNDTQNIYSLKDGSRPNNFFSTFRGSSDIIGTSFSTVWGEPSLYVFPTVGAQMSISSNNINDNISGTGARTILLNFLDSNYNEQTEVIALNGTTPVLTTSTDVFRINGVVVLSVGTTLYNEGIIYVGTGSVTAGKPATVYSHTAATTGFAFDGVFTLSADRIQSLYYVFISTSSSKQVEWEFNVFNLFGTGSKSTLLDVKKFISTVQMDLRGFSSLPQKLDIRLDAKVASGTTEVAFLASLFSKKV